MLEDISWWTSREYKAEQAERLRLQRETRQRRILRIGRLFEFYGISWADAMKMSDADLLKIPNFGAGSLKWFRRAGARPRLRAKMGRAVI
jgi:hypothetical protein